MTNLIRSSPSRCFVADLQGGPFSIGRCLNIDRSARMLRVDFQPKHAYGVPSAVNY